MNQVTFNGDDYVAKYKVILWDHFGLDKPDMKLFYRIHIIINQLSKKGLKKIQKNDRQ